MLKLKITTSLKMFSPKPLWSYCVYFDTFGTMPDCAGFITNTCFRKTLPWHFCSFGSNEKVFYAFCMKWLLAIASHRITCMCRKLERLLSRICIERIIFLSIDTTSTIMLFYSLYYSHKTKRISEVCSVQMNVPSTCRQEAAEEYI